MPQFEEEFSAARAVAWQRIEANWKGEDSDLKALQKRFNSGFNTLHDSFSQVYGARVDCEDHFGALLDLIADSWAARPAELKALDADRTAHPGRFSQGDMLGGVCYIDRFAENLDGLRAKIPYFQELGLTYLHLMPLFQAPERNSDGGYAVSSYRDVNPAFGDIDQLRSLAAELRASGISLVVDFIFNHTSNEHAWAKRALAGEKEFEDYYWVFPDREGPDAYEQTVREIFPDDHPGSFVKLPDGRWIWATFYHFQWDLNYSNPAVFTAMAGEMLFLANLGIEVLRMDAVAFIWKELGTVCESLPKAHTLIRAFNAVCRLAAPALQFKSEAIVHPNEVVRYIDPAECQLSYNPLQMALIWESLATREVALLSQALERRHSIPEGTTWVNYVRSHDDIGWTFSDEDAAELGIDAQAHRRFLNAFYVGRFDGSFARGVPFQDNPKTGDARVAGTTASLCGLEQDAAGAIGRIHLAHSIVLSTGGIPLIYLGDEVGQLNDYSFRDDADRRGDSRWVNRPAYPAERYAERGDPSTSAGLVFQGLRRLIEVRQTTPELAGGSLVGFGTRNAHVLGYQRPGAHSTVLVLANFADTTQVVSAETLSGFAPDALELTRRESVSLATGLALRPHEFAWLRVQPNSPVH